MYKVGFKTPGYGIQLVNQILMNQVMQCLHLQNQSLSQHPLEVALRVH